MGLQFASPTEALHQDAQILYPATLWKLIREDGLVFRWSTHNRNITFRGEVYNPGRGTSATAMQRGAGIRVNDRNFLGAIESDKITVADLLDRRYDNAQVFEYKIDWKYPFMEPAREDEYTLLQVGFDGEQWSGQIAGPGVWMSQKVGGVFARVCGFDVGDKDCRVDMGISPRRLYSQGVGTVDPIEPRRIFGGSSAMTTTDGKFQHGIVKWITGANEGLSREIKTYTGTGRIVELVYELPNDIQAGDLYDTSMGCNKVFGAKTAVGDCINEFANADNHGAFPHMAGADGAFRNPK